MKYVSFGICGLFVIILIVGLSLALIIDDYNGSDALNNVPLIDGWVIFVIITSLKNIKKEYI